MSYREIKIDRDWQEIRI